MKAFIGNVVRFLLPRDEHFFDGLQEIAKIVGKQAELIATLTQDNQSKWPEEIERIQRLERDTDEAVEALQGELQKSFIAPLDHGEFDLLAIALQRIAHRIGESALLLRIHAMKELPKNSITIASHIKAAVAEVCSNTERLRSRKDLSAIRSANREIRRLEAEVDLLTEQNIQQMHESMELEPKNIIFVWRGEVFVRSLERVLDACNDFATACGSVLVRNM